MPIEGPTRPPTLRFDFRSTDNTRTSRVFSNPRSVEIAYRLADIEPVFSRVEAELARGRHAAGFVAYEAAAAFDSALSTHEPLPNTPLAWFGIFDSEDAGFESRGPDEGRTPNVAWTPSLGRDAFDSAVTAIRAAIERGDTYQVNYTFRLTAAIDPADVSQLYLRLRDVHRPGYAAHLDLGADQILSLSPELFFRVDEGVLKSQPMKGTASRGLWDADDRKARDRLAESTKDRAENVMIVDLVRNDVSRVAELGTVTASSLFDLERFPAVWQMTSTIEGRLEPHVRMFDVFKALFPAGSITGAPKTSAMRAIRDLESTPRGIYTGAIGYMSPNGDAAFNVAIRTALVGADGRATAGIGGGITWESRSPHEFAEAMSKASFLEVPSPFDLFETMRLEAGVVVRRDRHLARLSASAAFLDFAYDATRVESALTETVQAHPSGAHRLRLLLSRTGTVTVDVSPIGHAPAVPASFVLASVPISTGDRRLYHKTTDRTLYDRARAIRGDAFDVLLWNDRGEITEFTIGNVVVELDGHCFTPPIECGLLGGVFRGQLIEQGLIAERVISKDDLRRATRIWLINSLREWVEVS
jgi:para-aminobenzoate synthetase / 4-amino-4-deoxychorismate lyase